MDNSKFIETVTTALHELTGNRHMLLGVPEDQWSEIRENFLSSHHTDEGDPNDSRKEEETHIVEAQNLFGAEFVEIID